MSENICPVCGCRYITRSSDFKLICKCDNPKWYDMISNAFDESFGKESKSQEGEQ